MRERWVEIGLRRALGATRGHVAVQFLGEAVSLALIGGVAGSIAGAATTFALALVRGWRVDLPWWIFAAGLGAAVAVGAAAGAYPAVRAARISPMEALRTG